MKIGAQKQLCTGSPTIRINILILHIIITYNIRDQSVVKSLLHREEQLVSEGEGKSKELQHVQDASLANGYKPWMCKILPWSNSQRYQNNTSRSTTSITMGMPYASGLSKNLNRVFRSYGINTYHKPYNTLRFLLVHPKDNAPPSPSPEKKTGVVHGIICNSCGNH